MQLESTILNKLKNIRKKDRKPIHFVIIDIGSNSVRMAIYEIKTNGEFEEVSRMKSDARLSEGMNEDRDLSQKAIDGTIAALSTFKKVYGQLDNVVVSAIATAAVREAKNQAYFLKKVEDSVGIKIRVLSGQEEAFYDFQGISPELNVKDYLLLDIGGASAEIVHVRNGKAVNYTSIPIGAVRISERFHLTGKVSAANLFSAQTYITEMYSRIPWLRKPAHYPIVLIGGAARALARINRKHQHLKHVDQIQNYQLTRKQIAMTIHMFLTKDLYGRQRINGLETSRADVIIGGSICLSTMMAFVDSKRVIFSNGGVREGIIKEYIANNPHRFDGE